MRRYEITSRTSVQRDPYVTLTLIETEGDHKWPLSVTNQILATKYGDRWVRGLHPIPCCFRCEDLGR